MDLGREINENIRSSIKTRLQELGSYIDDELPEYIMVMIANKRSQYQMTEDLSLFLGDDTDKFVVWVFQMMEKLQSVVKGSEQKNPKGGSPPQKENKATPKSKDEISHSTLTADKSQRKDKHKDDAGHSSRHTRKKRHEEDVIEVDSHDDGGSTNSLRSTVQVQTRKSSLPASKQANGSLLRRAMEEAKKSVSQRTNEYNPADVNPATWSKDKEVQKRQKAIYLKHHRELEQERQEINEEQGEAKQSDASAAGEQTSAVDDEGIELEVAENEFQEEKHLDGVNPDGSHRIVSFPGKQSTSFPDNQSPEEHQSTDSKRKQTHARERKRSKPTFLVTLDGAGSELAQKFDNEEITEKRRKKVNDGEENLIVDMAAVGGRPSVHSRLQFLPSPYSANNGIYQMQPLQGIGFPNGVPFNSYQGGPVVISPMTLPVRPEFAFQGQHTSLEAYRAGVPFPEAISTQTSVPVPSNNRGPIASRLSRPPPPVEKMHIRLDDNSDDDGAEPMDVSVEDSSGNKETVDSEKLERCRFWPDCKNGDSCPYIHPTIPCKSFPSCKYGNQCIFLHPMCKFDASCTNSKCYFSHSVKKTKSIVAPRPAHTTSAPFSQPPLVTCRFFPNCTKPNCPFPHPNTSSGSSSKPCRYGAMCSNKQCPFVHSAPKRGSRSMKWIAPTKESSHISDRPFALVDKTPGTLHEDAISDDASKQQNSVMQNNEPEKISVATPLVIEVEN